MPSSAPGESSSPPPRNAYGTVSDIRRDIAKTGATISEVHHDVANTQAMVSKILENQEGVGVQDESVSVIRTLSVTEKKPTAI